MLRERTDVPSLIVVIECRRLFDTADETRNLPFDSRIDQLDVPTNTNSRYALLAAVNFTYLHVIHKNAVR